MSNINDCVEECQYGVGPHVCFYKIPGASIGESQPLPEPEWPENFEPDPDCHGLGVWHACGWKRDRPTPSEAA